MPRLAVAREKLEGRDLEGALTIYEEVLAASGDRADVLVTISGDLGTYGHVQPVVELVAPRYDAQRHGPATGLNLLQAYLALRNPGAAQHVLDILFALNRPELEDRLYGFSNAIADMMAISSTSSETVAGALAGEAPKVAIVTITKPIWFYGLEELAAEILPAKERSPRRVAFAQLALPDHPQMDAAAQQPEDELGRLSRGIPLWLAETFFFSPHYASSAAVGLLDDPAAGKHYALFGTEWSQDHLRQLVETTADGLDYVFTGVLRQTAGDYELLLRVFEVNKFRERKTFSARWTPGNVDGELTKLQEQIRLFMEWKPAQAALAYQPSAQPRPWCDVLSASLAMFLADKGLLPAAQVAAPQAALAHAAQHAATSEAASLAYLTLAARGKKLGFTDSGTPPLVSSPLVEQAQHVLR